VRSEAELVRADGCACGEDHVAGQVDDAVARERVDGVGGGDRICQQVASSPRLSGAGCDSSRAPKTTR
jgi:hypothetical protein